MLWEVASAVIEFQEGMNGIRRAADDVDVVLSATLLCAAALIYGITQVSMLEPLADAYSKLHTSYITLHRTQLSSGVVLLAWHLLSAQL